MNPTFAIFADMLHAQTWDSNIWLCGWFKATSTRNGDSRPLLKKVFTHNLEIFRDGAYRTENGTTIALDVHGEHLGQARMYSAPIVLPQTYTKEETVVEVIEQDCIEALADLVANGYNPAILNMASLYHPGGGVLDGSSAQEEDLCRRSTLAVSLYQFSLTGGKHGDLAQMVGVQRRQERYPMDNLDGGIYSPGITFFRSSRDAGYRLSEHPFQAAVVSVAALNYNPKHGHSTLEMGKIPESDVPVIKEKMRTILRIGIENGHDSMVLGAFGCGAFCTPAPQQARLFHQVIDEPEFRGRFRRLTFAIIDSPNSNNFKPFKTELAK